jgi:hypothetical protein
MTAFLSPVSLLVSIMLNHMMLWNVISDACMVAGPTFWAQNSLFMTVNLPTVEDLFLQAVLAGVLDLNKWLHEYLLGATMLHILHMN